jgi:DNA-binding winged helix-turn-helix (wHTH) protein/tetratricopeptide (TPR) repeat protein
MRHTFLDFELDEELYELRSRGEVIATQARVFALIAYLLHHRQRVVSKDELMGAIWKGTVVSDAAISQVIMLARKALRDEGDAQRIIKTVRARGFRFVASVGTAEVEAPSLPPPAASAQLQAPAPVFVQSNKTSPCESRPALFGRVRELDALGLRLAQAERGRGGIVLIEGEPGIGKTSLAAELAARAAASGAAIDVTWGRAWEEGGAPPFWPWIQVLRAIAQREGAERMRALLGSSAGELAPLLPELAATTAQRPETLGQNLDGLRTRFRLFDTMTRFFSSLCAQAQADGDQDPHTRLIILDDLHAVDEASVQLLRFLLPDLASMPLLVVATCRDIEIVPGSALSTLVDSCTDPDQRIQLRGIAQADVAALLQRKLGSAPSERNNAAVYEVSAGNPLLVMALAERIAVSDPEPAFEMSQLASFTLPERILGAVRKHLSELPQETVAALSAASAFGRQFSLARLAELHACSAAALQEVLDPALRRGVVRPAVLGGSVWAFSHALVCHAVYSELTPTRRLCLHRQIAELLEQSSPAERPPLYELAHHYFLAAADGCRAKALEYTQRAAAEANNMLAYEAAADLYERALSLAELEHADAALSHVLRCSAAMAYYAAGDLTRATARAERAAEVARAEQNPERLAWAVLLLASALRGTILHDRARQAQLREALAILPAADSGIRAMLLAASALAVESLAERETITLQAVEMARRIPDEYALRWALNARHLVLWGGAPPEQLLAISAEMIELGRATQDHELLLDALMWRMADYGELGDVSAVLSVHAEYWVVAERFGSPWHRYMAVGSDIFASFCKGEPIDHARKLSERTLQSGLRLSEPYADGFYEVRSLFFDFHQGLLPTSAPAEAPSCVPEDYRPFWALAWAVGDRADAARRMVSKVLASEAERQLRVPLRRPVLAIMALVSVLLGDAALAAELYRVLLPEAGRHLSLQAFVYLGPVQFYLGVLAATCGDKQRAAEHLEEALSGSVGSAVMTAYVRYALSRVLTAEGPCERATQLVHDAEQAAKALGIGYLQRQIERDQAQPACHS